MDLLRLKVVPLIEIRRMTDSFVESSNFTESPT